MQLRNFLVIMSVFVLLSISFGVTIQSGEASITRDTGIDPSVDGPSEFFVNETVSYEVEIKGHFRTEEGRFDAREADNWTLQTESTLEATIEPEEEESFTSNVFTVNVTIHEEGEGKLNFRASCGKEDEMAFNEKEFQIFVEKAERTSVTILNPTDTHIEELQVALYINGELKAMQTIQDFEPEEERRVTFEWSKRGLNPGEHTLEVWTGRAENDQEFNKENLVMSRTFQIEEETSSIVYAGVIVAVIAAGVLIFFWYKSRRRKQRRPW